MNKKDQLKVLAEGFTIVSACDTPHYRIKYIDNEAREWRTLEYNFKSAAARNARLKQLLDDPKIIND